MDQLSFNIVFEKDPLKQFDNLFCPYSGRLVYEGVKRNGTIYDTVSSGNVYENTFEKMLSSSIDDEEDVFSIIRIQSDVIITKINESNGSKETPFIHLSSFVSLLNDNDFQTISTYNIPSCYLHLGNITPLVVFF